MAEEKDNASDPVTLDVVNAAIAQAIKPVTEALTPMAQTLKSLGDNQKILADTLAKLPPAGVDTKEGGEDAAKKNAAAAQPLTAEAVMKVVTDAIAADRKAQQQTVEQRAAREAFVKNAENGLDKLPPEYQDRLGPDPTKWGEEAKGITASWQRFVKDAGIKVPDVGGANREGGEAGAGGAAQAAPQTPRGVSNLPEGTAAFAKSLQMPGDPPRAAATATAAK